MFCPCRAFGDGVALHLQVSSVFLVPKETSPALGHEETVEVPGLLVTPWSRSALNLQSESPPSHDWLVVGNGLST